MMSYCQDGDHGIISWRKVLPSGDITWHICPAHMQQHSSVYRLSLAIHDHSVTCHPTQVNTPCLNPIQTGRYSIYLPRRDGRLSWPRWLVTYRDGLPARRRSPIQVLTQPGVELATCWSQVRRPNHYIRKPEVVTSRSSSSFIHT